MLQLLSYTFCRIYFWYHGRLRDERGMLHYYSSFVLAFLVFGNVFLVVTIFALLVFGQPFFEVLLDFYILIGNIAVFGVVLVVSLKRRYIRMIQKFKNLSGADRSRMDTVSLYYIIVSLMSLVLFMVFQVAFYLAKS